MHILGCFCALVSDDSRRQL